MDLYLTCLISISPWPNKVQPLWNGGFYGLMAFGLVGLWLCDLTLKSQEKILLTLNFPKFVFEKFAFSYYVFDTLSWSQKPDLIKEACKDSQWFHLLHDRNICCVGTTLLTVWKRSSWPVKTPFNREWDPQLDQPKNTHVILDQGTRHTNKKAKYTISLIQQFLAII